MQLCHCVCWKGVSLLPNRQSLTYTHGPGAMQATGGLSCTPPPPPCAVRCPAVYLCWFYLNLLPPASDADAGLKPTKHKHPKKALVLQDYRSPQRAYQGARPRCQPRPVARCHCLWAVGQNQDAEPNARRPGSPELHRPSSCMDHQRDQQSGARGPGARSDAPRGRGPLTPAMREFEFPVANLANSMLLQGCSRLLSQLRLPQYQHRAALVGLPLRRRPCLF